MAAAKIGALIKVGRINRQKKRLNCQCNSTLTSGFTYKRNRGDKKGHSRCREISVGAGNEFAEMFNRTYLLSTVVVLVSASMPLINEQQLDAIVQNNSESEKFRISNQHVKNMMIVLFIVNS